LQNFPAQIFCGFSKIAQKAVLSISCRHATLPFAHDLFVFHWQAYLSFIAHLIGYFVVFSWFISFGSEEHMKVSCKNSISAFHFPSRETGMR